MAVDETRDDAPPANVDPVVGVRWRTLPDEVTVEQAQVSVDDFARLRGDTRLRPSTGDRRASVVTVAAAEPLRPVPATAYPAMITEHRAVSRQALVAYRGNRYSVPPELAGGQAVVSHPVGADHLDLAVHPAGEARRPGLVSEVVAVPFRALLAVRSAPG